MNYKELVASAIQPHNVTGSSSYCSINIDKTSKVFPDEIVTIRVTPNSGYRLLSSGISITQSNGVNVPYQLNGNVITFTMPAYHVTVRITCSVIPTYSVTLRLGGSYGSSSIWASKTTGIYEGETITVNVSPASHFYITGWSSNPGVSFSGSGNSRSFRMPAANVTITVNMTEEAKYNITINNANSNLGTVTVSKTQAYAGEYITIYSHATGGIYYNCNVTGVGTVTSGFTMPAQNVTVTSYFESYGTQSVRCTIQFDMYGVGDTSGYYITINGVRCDCGSTASVTLRNGSSYTITRGGNDIHSYDIDITFGAETVWLYAYGVDSTTATFKVQSSVTSYTIYATGDLGG